MFYDKEGIYVVDDAFSPEQINFLERYILDVNVAHLKWTFNHQTNYPEHLRRKDKESSDADANYSNFIRNRKTFDHYFFTHSLMHCDDPRSEHADSIIPLFRPIFKEFYGNNDYNILRSKINLTTTTPRTRKIFEPHIDVGQKAWAVLYYVNTVPNAHTFIMKEYYNGQKRDKFTISKKIEAKAGRFVFFDAARFHSAGKCPENYKRCVINFNIGRYNDLEKIDF